MRLLLIILLAILLPLAATANGSNHHNTSNSSRSESSADARSDADARAEVDSHDTYEAAASSAALYLEGCNGGAAAQGLGFGVALGGESRVCQLLRVAAAAQDIGMHYEASVAIRQAFEEAGVRPGEQPLLARFFRGVRREVVQPLFGWLPFVGQGA